MSYSPTSKQMGAVMCLSLCPYTAGKSARFTWLSAGNFIAVVASPSH
jgi:hypothetical protein